MGIEIERKFLVTDTSMLRGDGVLYRQGYIKSERPRTVRIRLADGQGILTVKGHTQGLTRSEFEWPIRADDADFLLRHLCHQPLIEKRRYKIPHAGHIWEVDVFAGANEGLILAEVELQSEEESVVLPPWVGREVSHDRRYFNSALAERPYCDWVDQDHE